MLECIFHGHSFVEIRNGHITLLIDPYITGNPQCDITVQQACEKKPQAIILTHGHDDHIGDTLEIVKQTWAQIITSYDLAKYFTSELGIENTSGHGTGGWVQYDWFHVKLFQARHGGGISSWKDWYTVAAWVIVTIDDKKIYHAGDTGLFGDMRLLHEYDHINLAFLPIWDRYTMWVDDAVIATSFIRPDYVVPIHFNTWPKIKVDEQEFARRVMLDQTATPKVLTSWQAVVFS